MISKKFLQFATIADMLKDQAESMNEIWAKELTRTDELLIFSEIEKSGKRLDEIINYRDYLWQMKHLIDQVESLCSDKVASPADFLIP